MINHKDPTAIIDLVTDLRQTPRGKKARILVDTLDNKLMKAGFITGLMAKVFGWEKIVFTIYENDPEAIDTMWESMLDHILTGTDSVDPESAGGFSGPEMELFVRLLELRGYRLKS